jgi:paraquat-inducible protein B
VLVGVGLLVGGVIVLGVGELFAKRIMVETYLDGSVAGLSVGAPVEYRGVWIGKVSRIGFVNEKYRMASAADEARFGKYVLIEIAIDPNKLPQASLEERKKLLAARVESGLRVRLQSSLTGPTILQADYFDPNVYRPLEIAWTPEELYVPSAPGTMAQVVSAVERLAAQVEQAEIGKTVQNINTLALNMDKAVRRIADLVVTERQDLALIISNLRKITSDVAAMSDDARENPSRVVFGNPPPRRAPGEKR